MSDHFIDEFNALLQLVDEPDHAMYAMIEGRILEHGYPMMPFLREALDNHFRENVLDRIHALIHKINLKYISEELLKWKQMGAGNLMHGLFLISKYQHPFADIEDLKKQISDLKYDIWIEINNKLTILENIRVFNHVFYDVHGYKPNRTDYHNPLNSFIIDVLNTKSGSPVLMASVYIIIAQMLGLPVYGVNLPEHFVCVVTNGKADDALTFLPKSAPLFYINAFSEGALFTKVQLSSFIKKLEIEERPEYFVPCKNEDIIARVLNNLINAYKKAGETHKQEDILTIQSVFSKEG